MEQAAHRLLSEGGQAYTDPFSKVFEAYVIGLIREAELQLTTDAEFKNLGNSSLPAVDAIIEFVGVNVFVEAKMSLFADEVMLTDSPQRLFQKMRRVREAITQGWNVGSHLRNGTVAVGKCAYAQQDFLLIVTSRQLLCCSGEDLKRMLGENVFDNINPEGKFGSPSMEQIRNLPPKNIFVVSIEEFEHLVGCIAACEVSLPELLQEVADLAGSPATSSFFFDQILEKKSERWRMPRVLNAVRERLETHFATLSKS